MPIPSRRVLGFLALAIVIAAVPLTVFVAQKQQELRQRASELPTEQTATSVSFELVPTTPQPVLGQSFTVDVYANTGANNVSGVDFTVTFPTNTLSLSEFKPSDTFGNILAKTVEEGKLRHAAGILGTTGVNGRVKVGTLIFEPKATGDAGVSFENVQITGIGKLEPLAYEDKGATTYTVAETATPATFGKAINVTNPDLSNAKGIVIDRGSRYTPESEFTIEFWLKFNTQVVGETILDLGNGRLKFGTKSVAEHPKGTIFYVFTTDATGGKTYYPSQTILNDITGWHHTAITSKDGKYVFYFDGKYENMLNLNVTVSDENRRLEIGKVGDAQIDEIRISDKARYPTAYVDPQTYTTPRAPFSVDANTLALLHLDGNTNDTTGNGNNGSLFGNTVFVDSTIGLPPTPTPIRPTLSPSPSPTPLPPVPPTVDKSAVGCISGPYGTGPYGASGITIHWLNRARPITIVDISPDRNFAVVYRRQVSGQPYALGQTTAPSGFNGYVGATGPLYINPNATYWVRISEGFGYSDPIGFSLPLCATPTPSPTPTPTPSPTPITCSTPVNACRADINRNGPVTVNDWTVLARCQGQAPAGPCTYGDYNGNGTIDQEDLACLQEKYNTLCADINIPTPDGVVNILDFSTFADAFRKWIAGEYLEKADFNNDGKVDLLDFEMLRAVFNKTLVAPATR